MRFYKVKIGIYMMNLYPKDKKKYKNVGTNQITPNFMSYYAECLCKFKNK